MNNTIDIRRLNKPAAAPETGRSEEKEPAGLWAFLNRDIQLFGSGIPDKVREALYMELSTLLEAGVDIRSALQLIIQEQSKKKFRLLFTQIAQEVEAGSTLSAALEKNGSFTAYEYHSVHIGEETGRLVIVLKELALFYERKIRQSRQIIGALIYPCVVMAVAAGAVSFMLTYVVPMFADVLKRSGGHLPFITKVVLEMANVLKRSAGMLVLVFVATAILLYSQRKKDYFRRVSSALTLRIPMIGGIVRKLYLSRLANTLSLLIGAKLPIVQSLHLVKQMIRFYPIERSLEESEKEIITGTPLYKCLEKHSIYPVRMISLIKGGEEVNQMELFFNRIAEQYANEVEYQTGMLSKFIEPLIIVILGLVVGVILIAMYLPMFQLGQSF